MRLFFVFVGAHPVGDGVAHALNSIALQAIAHGVGSYKIHPLPVAHDFKGLDQ